MSRRSTRSWSACTRYTVIITLPSLIHASTTLRIPLASQLLANSTTPAQVSSAFPFHSLPGIRVPPRWSFSLGFLPDTFVTSSSSGLTCSATTQDDSALPKWLKFDGSIVTFFGVTPRKFGSFNITVTCRDDGSTSEGQGASASAWFILQIGQATLEISTPRPPLPVMAGNLLSFNVSEIRSHLQRDGILISNDEPIQILVNTERVPWLSFNRSSRIVSGTAPYSLEGGSASPLAFNITIVDQNGNQFTIRQELDVRPTYFVAYNLPAVSLPPRQALALDIQEYIRPLYRSTALQVSFAMDDAYFVDWIYFDPETMMLIGVPPHSSRSRHRAIAPRDEQVSIRQIIGVFTTVQPETGLRSTSRLAISFAVTPEPPTPPQSRLFVHSDVFIALISMFGVVVLLALGAFLFRFCMRRRRDRLSGHAQVANVHLDRRHRREMSKVKAHDERSNSLQPSPGLMQSSNPGIESNAVTDLGEEDDPAIAQHHSDRIISTADLQQTMAENSAGVYIGPGKQQTKNSTQSVSTNDGPFMDRSDSPAFNVTGTTEEIDSKPAKCSSRLLPSPDQSEDLNINDVAENPQNHPTPLLSRSLSSVDSLLPRRHRFMRESSASRPSNLLDENPPSNGLFSGGNQIANGPPVKFTDTGNERIEAGRHPTELGDSGWEARDSELVAFYQSEFVLKDKDAESRCDSESGLSNAESERTKAQRMSKARSHQSLPDVNSEYYPKQNRSDTLRQSELLYTGSPFFSSRHRPRTPSDFYSSDDSRRNTQLNIRDSIIAKRKPTVASRSCPELNNTSDITEQTHGFRPLGSSSGMSNSIATQVDAPQGGGTFLSSSYSRGPLPLDRSNYFSEPSETLGELTRSSSEIFHLVSRWDVSIRQMDRSFLRSTSRLRVSNLAPLETNADTSALLSGTAYQHTSTTQQGATTSPSSAWEF